MTAQAIEVFAPAKINLTLHVTGQRADGYHLLDSLVMFADVGDRVTVARASEMSLRVTGPMAAGVPDDARNLCWKAAEAFGEPVAITLDKHLPAAAGIGGGSSDAAAVLRGMEQLFGRPSGVHLPDLGADVPVCMLAHAARMQGIGEQVTPLDLQPLDVILVNPRVEVSTPAVFKALDRRDNPPMTPMPEGPRSRDVLTWLAEQRNDLEAPASDLRPEIGQVLRELSFLDGVRLVRMSGSGATCFAVFESRGLHEVMAQEMRRNFPQWWVEYATLS
ncbi:4-diphosphocytidyl-2-C-methyl-D-erythritol kinase [Mameliella alba]|uniref:4-(cytidine 5'-diphospho)-2-C-methyl-D-erythritol kinase n=1 Tax=Mameliella alba TaxID=561184 RepID=UPI0008802C21|nr:4-(cytidine 5'-diphospho)-2-C-methyl-D-erythritol kinase [Mameliella alba]OWV46730.1 4-(cytidine 5'-diphospho)-2-C-methyl-D-erythritol kinase [Mameliella alba]PTR37642.1 4-diphosphocytidyl-2-C-methyl-D-erythritol kinase [Mameliella alba]GGF49799.1 4-diphosphocytidyl-2-C-methyl-D-erythritol kinase [Mameliella alba]SDD65502.1 4-diphosphocytidyl-2-C-methyl-D-erythritol kinase [Mameliella alba]